MRPEDRTTRELRRVTSDLGKRAAAGGAALAALVSLLSQAPVDTACLRGGIVYVAVRLATRYGSRALGRAASIELAAEAERDSG